MITEETLQALEQYNNFVDDVKAQISYLVKSLSGNYSLRLAVDKSELLVTITETVTTGITTTSKNYVFHIDIDFKSVDAILQEVDEELRWL